MDILKAEIERKRKQIQKAEVVAPEKKYFRRGDLAAKQQDEYWTKYYEKNKIGGKKETVENKLQVGSEEAVALLEEDEDSNQHVSHEEIVRRLRERAQPIRLFGETERDTLRRLRKLEIEAPEMKEVREEGRRNDFQYAMSQVDQEYVKEVVEGTLNERGRHDVKVDAKLQTIEEIREMADDLGKGENPKRDCEIIYSFFNYLLQRWGHDLNARPERVKRSGEGKFAAARHAQTVEHVKPLFSKLKAKVIQDDIRVHLVPITRYLLDRDYIQANNAYMEMAVGNAPWPVGVTRSGIHQRPGSEKAYVKNIAHVLNDETQRKYIQGLKRFMTKCQEYFPSDPSKSVDFVPTSQSETD